MTTFRAANDDIITLLVGPSPDAINIHRSTLSQSLFFSRLLEKGHPRTIKLPKEEPIYITALVRLLYREEPSSRDQTPPVPSHQLWALAQRFEVQGLSERVFGWLTFDTPSAQVVDVANSSPAATATISPLRQVLVRHTAIKQLLNRCHKSGALARANNKKPLSVKKYAKWISDVADAVRKMSDLRGMQRSIDSLDAKVFHANLRLGDAAYERMVERFDAFVEEREKGMVTK